VRVAPVVEAVVLGALAKQPEQRPSSAGQLAAALAEAARRSTRRLRRPVAVIAGAVIAATAALALATQTQGRIGSTPWPGRVDSAIASRAAPLVTSEPPAVRLLVAPSGAEVSLDGAKVDSGSGRLDLPPGEHRLVVSAPGYVTVDRIVTAVSVGPELHIRLARDPAKKHPRIRPASPPPETRPTER